MTSKRKKKDFGFKPHEKTPRSANNHHMRITEDMMTSKAWSELTLYAEVVFFHMKMKYNGHNDNNISFTLREATKIMHKNTFNKAIDQLVALGFIRIVKLQWTIRKPNIYGFSDEWQR